MLWKIDKFEIYTGENLKVKFSNVPCVYQIKCQSSKMNDAPDDFQSRRTCYINFVDGVPPNSVCFPVDWYNLPESPYPDDVPGNVCSFSLKLDQFAYFFSILTKTDVYLSIDEDHPKLTQVIAKSIDKTPPQIIASDPINETRGVAINKNG